MQMLREKNQISFLLKNNEYLRVFSLKNDLNYQNISWTFKNLIPGPEANLRANDSNGSKYIVIEKRQVLKNKKKIEIEVKHIFDDELIKLQTDEYQSYIEEIFKTKGFEFIQKLMRNQLHPTPVI